MGLCNSKVVKTLEKDAIEEAKKLAPVVVDVVKVELSSLVDTVGKKVEDVIPVSAGVVETTVKAAESQAPTVIEAVKGEVVKKTEVI
jgi:hypothetical protein